MRAGTDGGGGRDKLLRHTCDASVTASAAAGMVRLGGRSQVRLACPVESARARYCLASVRDRERAVHKHALTSPLGGSAGSGGTPKLTSRANACSTDCHAVNTTEPAPPNKRLARPRFSTPQIVIQVVNRLSTAPCNSPVHECVSTCACTHTHTITDAKASLTSASACS